MIQLDPQAIGWEDDRSEGGHVRAKITRGDLVRLPFRSTSFRAETVGSATATYQVGLTGNRDGSGNGINCVTAATLDNGVRIWVPFTGRIFGVRWRRGGSTATPPFTVSIDGEAFTPPHYADDYLTSMELGGSSVQDDEATWIVADDLPSGHHLAEIVLTTNGAGVLTLVLYGIVVDGWAGYKEPAPVTIIGTGSPVTITDSFVEIPAGRASANQIRGISKILYYNTHTSAVTVQVRYSTTVIWEVVLAAAGAAGASATLDFNPPLSPSLATGYTHKADVTGKVNATVFGIV